jgi:hypothetical protein
MILLFIFMATMVVTGIPTAILFIPWCWLTGNVLPLYKGTRFMLSSSCWMAGVRFHVEGLENACPGTARASSCRTTFPTSTRPR